MLQQLYANMDSVSQTRISGPKWDDYRVFLQIYRLRTLTAAAQALGISQSTASRRLTDLEQEVGAPLFDRTPEGLLATELAHTLLPHVEALELETMEMARLIAGQASGPTGRVRIALPQGLADLGFVPRLLSFQKKYPSLALDVVVGNSVVDLMRREADIALRFVAPQRGDLVAKKVMTLEKGAYAAASLLEGNASFDALPWILLEDPEQLYSETQWYKRHVSHAPWMQTTNYMTMLAAMRAGLGAGLISRLGASQLGLVELDLDCDPPEPSGLYLVTHRSLRKVPRVAVVWQWILAQIEEIQHELPGPGAAQEARATQGDA